MLFHKMDFIFIDYKPLCCDNFFYESKYLGCYIIS